jgi:hypothetical protein
MPLSRERPTRIMRGSGTWFKRKAPREGAAVGKPKKYGSQIVTAALYFAARTLGWIIAGFTGY